MLDGSVECCIHYGRLCRFVDLASITSRSSLEGGAGGRTIKVPEGGGAGGPTVGRVGLVGLVGRGGGVGFEVGRGVGLVSGHWLQK